jgi:hypothetical protein
MRLPLSPRLVVIINLKYTQKKHVPQALEPYLKLSGLPCYGKRHFDKANFNKVKI